MTAPSDEAPSTSLRPSLHLTDAVAIIVGIVVGVSIFKVPPIIFGHAGTPAMGLALWAFGGLLSVIGACCYAELATTYPHSGGDYHYLTVAFGRGVGFLFGWAQLAVILTSSVGQMAYVFADYAAEIFPLGPEGSLATAIAVVGILTAVNLLGVSSGKWTQNILTLAKIAGLLAIITAGFYLAFAAVSGADSPSAIATDSDAPMSPAIGLAMVFVLYAFGGWNDSAFVAAEVHDPHRNIPRALWWGLGLITSLYLLVNLAYLAGLGFAGLRASSAPAADLLERATGIQGKVAMSLLVMVSAAGAINGMILTGARVYARLGEDHALFAWLGKWNHRLGTPSRSLIAQAVVACTMILLVGSQAGRDLIDRCVRPVWRDGLPWDEYFGGFETLVAGTAPVFWAFFLSTGIAFFVLRWKEPHVKRPFRVPFFPITPLVFCAMCGYMLYSSLAYARGLSAIGIVPLVVGIPMYLISRKKSVGEAS